MGKGDDPWVILRVHPLSRRSFSIGYSDQDGSAAHRVVSSDELIHGEKAQDALRPLVAGIGGLLPRCPWSMALGRRVRLPIFVDASAFDTPILWRALIDMALTSAEIAPSDVRMVQLARGRRPPPADFRLPLKVLTVGSAALSLRSAINAHSWLSEVEGADGGLDVEWRWARKIVMRIFAGAETDILICDARHLRALSFMLRATAHRPRLVVALIETGTPSAARPPAVSALPAGSSLLMLPFGGELGSASDALTQLMYDFAHDLPLQEFGCRISPENPAERPSLLVSTPADLQSLRLSHAIAGVTEEAMSLAGAGTAHGIDQMIDYLEAPGVARVSLVGALRNLTRPSAAENAYGHLAGPEFGASIGQVYLANLRHDGFRQEALGWVPLSHTRRRLAEERDREREFAAALANFAEDPPINQVLQSQQERVVDVTLQRLAPDGTGCSFVAHEDVLLVGTSYRARVQIGARSPVSLVSGIPPPIGALLPPPKNGRRHVLHVALFADPEDFTVDSPALQRLELPEIGSSPAIHFDMRPMRPAQKAQARIAIYYDLPPDAGEDTYRNHLLQSFLLTCTTARSAAEADPMGLPAAVDLEFSLTRRFKALEDLRPRYLSVAFNDGPGDGRHTLMMKRGARAGSVTLPEATLKDALDGIRDVLDWGSKNDARTGPRFPAEASLGAEDDFNQVVWKIAKQGGELHKSLFLAVPDRDLLDGIRGARARCDDVIQIVHHAFNFPFPWPLLYDFDLPPDIAGAPAPEVCKGFMRERNGAPLSCRECLAECLHPNKKTAVCAYGFWGLRHQVEQLLPDNCEKDETVVLRPMRDGAIGVLIGLDTAYLSRIPSDLAAKFGVQRIKNFPAGRDPLPTLWSEAERPAIWLLAGHYETHDIVGEVTGPRITLGGGLYLRPADVADKFLNDRDWRGDPRSIVLLAACEGAVIDIREVVNFVNSFTRAGAGAVIGPETIVFDGLARRFGVELVDLIVGGASVGAAVLEFRRRLLRELNPLGLVFTPYGFADLAAPHEAALAGAIP